MEAVLRKKRVLSATGSHDLIGVQANDSFTPRRRQCPSPLQMTRASPDLLRKCQGTRQQAKEAQVVEKCLTTLHKLLAQLPREKRHKILAKDLSELQRRALEQWMLRLREQRQPKEVLSKRKHSDPWGACPKKHMVSQAAPRARVLLNPSGIASVQMKGNRYYYAYILVDGLELLSRRVRDANKVQHFHAVLALIKDKLKTAVGPVDETLKIAIEDGVAESTVSLRDLGLKFKIVSRFLWIRRPLRSRSFCVSTEMEKGLQFWRKLMLARYGGVEVRHGRKHVLNDFAPDKLQQAWCEFKAEYVNLMQSSSRVSRPDVMQQRLQALEDERDRHFQRQMELWNLKQMRTAEQEQRDQQNALQHRSACMGNDWTDQSGQLVVTVPADASCDPTTKVEQRILAILQRWTRVCKT